MLLGRAVTKSDYMLGHPSIPRYHRAVRCDVYDGDNVTGADNQQERLESAESESEAANWFLAGFIEGEGALCVSVKKHPTCRSAARGRPSSGSAKFSRRWSEVNTVSPRVWLKS